MEDSNDRAPRSPGADWHGEPALLQQLDEERTHIRVILDDHGIAVVLAHH